MVINNGITVCTGTNYTDHTMMERYVYELKPHKLYPYNHPKYKEISVNEMSDISRLDFFLREAIGKTNDIHVSICSHQAIINRELPDHFCRVCNKDMSKICGRINDYLVMRHPQCTKPICFDCAENRPDAFYIAYQRGYEKYKIMKMVLGSRYLENENQ
jgi:hypothetical protein